MAFALSHTYSPLPESKDHVLICTHNCKAYRETELLSLCPHHVGRAHLVYALAAANNLGPQ